MYTHEAIMERLEDIAIDRYLPLKVYEESVDDWDGIPIVYAQEHPDMALFIQDPEKALKKIDGRIIGKITNPRIEKEGQPRVVATYEWDDPEVEELYKKGIIATSTGSFCESEQDPKLPEGVKKLTGKQIPNHLLIFKRDEQNLPKDKGTYILNKEEINLPEPIENRGATISKENASELRGILDKLQSLFKKMTSTQEDELKESPPEKIEKTLKREENLNQEEEKMKEQLDALTKELEEKNKSISELQAKVDEQAKSIETFEKEREELKQKEMEKAWEDVKSNLPPGLTHKEDSEKELKTLYFENPHEFIAKVTKIKPKKETEPEGEAHAFKENTSTGMTVGSFDMKKKEFVK